MPNPPMSEVPPVAGVPGPTGVVDQNWLQFLRNAMQQQAQQRQQQQQTAGPAGTRALPGPVSQANVQGVVQPRIGGAPLQTGPYPVTQQMPGVGGMPQQPAAVGGMAGLQGAGAVPQADPVPTGVGVQPQMPQLSGRQIPQAQQQPYYQGGQTGQGVIANSIIGLGNLLSRTHQEDQEKEMQAAENDYSQIQTYQETLGKLYAAGATDNDPMVQQTKKMLDDKLRDPKVRKRMEDALGYFMPTANGNGDQGGGGAAKAQPPGPASTGVLNAIKKRGRQVAGAFDPRTASQRMPAGQQLPAPNTPGGVQFQYPQADPVAQLKQKNIMAMAQATDDILSGKVDIKDPSKLDAIHQAAAQNLGLIMTPKEKATYEVGMARVGEQQDIGWARIALGYDQLDAITGYRKTMGQVAQQNANTRARAAGVDPKYAIPATAGPGWLPDDPTYRAEILMLDNLDLDPKDISSRAAPGRWSRDLIETATNTYDPNWNSGNYPRAYRTKLEYTNPDSSTGKGLTSLNNFFKHSSELAQSAMRLDNDDWVEINRLRSGPFGRALTKSGRPNVANFGQLQEVVASEGAAMVKYGVGTVAEIEAWRKKMDVANTPAEFAAQFEALHVLARGREQTFIGNWDRMTGSTGLRRPRDVSILDNDSRKAAANMGWTDTVTIDENGMQRVPPTPQQTFGSVPYQPPSDNNVWVGTPPPQ